MLEESNTITIARPVGVVFTFLADAENENDHRAMVRRQVARVHRFACSRAMPVPAVT